MDKVMTESIKQVEDSCGWFLKTMAGETELTRLAQGLVFVTKALRSLMIIVEQQNSEKDVLEVELLQTQQQCSNHSHLRTVSFSSKGQFFLRGADTHSSGAMGMLMLSKPMTALDVLKAGYDAEKLVGGVQAAIHHLIIGKSSTQKMAQA